MSTSPPPPPFPKKSPKPLWKRRWVWGIAGVFLVYGFGFYSGAKWSSSPASKTPLQASAAKPPINESAEWQGRDVRFWARQLKDRDPSVSQKAGEALNGLGKDGVAALVAGILDEDPAVRTTAMNYLNGEYAGPYFDDLWPLFQLILEKGAKAGGINNDNYAAHSQVIDRLGDMGPAARKALPMLERAFRLQTPTTVQGTHYQRLETAIRKISGKTPDNNPEGKIGIEVKVINDERTGGKGTK